MDIDIINIIFFRTTIYLAAVNSLSFGKIILRLLVFSSGVSKTADLIRGMVYQRVIHRTVEYQRVSISEQLI